MKLLRVIVSMDPFDGGPCQGIRNSIPALQKLGVENEVVSLDDPNATFIKNATFPIYALGRGRGPWSYHPQLYSWLLENFCNYDAIIIHGLWLYYSYAVSSAMKRYKVIWDNGHSRIPKLFVMPHGMLDPYFQKAPDRKLKAIRNYFYWKLIERNVINNSDGVLFTCEEELQLAKEPFKPYNPKREINVGYGIESPPRIEEINMEAFFKKCPEVKNRKFLLFMSRIHPKKGLDLLLNAYLKKLEECQQKYPTSDEDLPILVVAGPGMEKEYGKELRSIVSKNPKGLENVVFPGMLSGHEKWGALYTCAAFLLPSHQENFGIAVVEALACGKPVLISNQVNIWREIEYGGGGFIENDSLEGVERLLDKWFATSEKKKVEMGENAYKIFQDHFSIEPAAKKLKQVIFEE
jgi:glycosyltransferase involved in cell wall biosynthesis